MSSWDAAERSPFFAAVLGAVASAEVPAPHEAPAGPSFFQFTDDVVFRALLEDAGFEAVAVDAIAVEIPVASANELITSLADGTVRVGAALRAADDMQRDRMRESLEERLANGVAVLDSPFPHHEARERDEGRRERDQDR